ETFGPFAVRDDVPGPRLTVEAMGGGTDSHVGDAGPVGGVVARSAAREPVIGDFVVHEARGGQRVVRVKIVVRVGVLPCFDGFAAINPVGEWRVRLDGQAVQ